MKNYLRLLGAFFLISFIFCARAEVLAVSEAADYSLNINDIKHRGGIVLSSRNDHPFPADVLDEKDKSIRFKNVQEDNIPLFSLVVSGVSFLAAVGLPIYIDRRNRKKSVVDDFWARQVIYPEYIKPVMIFRSWVMDIYFDNLDESFFETWNSNIENQTHIINEMANICSVVGLKFDGKEMIKIFSEFQDKSTLYMNSVFSNEPKAERKKNFDDMRSSLDSYQLKMVGFLKNIQNQR